MAFKKIAGKLIRVIEKRRPGTPFIGTRKIKYGKKVGARRGKVGRPAGPSGKYIHPRTGRPVRATEFYKIRRAALRRAKAQMAARQIQAIRRGIPQRRVPTTVSQRRVPEEAPIQARVIPTRQVQQIAPQVAPQGRVVRDIMTGRPIIKPIPQKERWQQE